MGGAGRSAGRRVVTVGMVAAAVGAGILAGATASGPGVLAENGVIHMQHVVADNGVIHMQNVLAENGVIHLDGGGRLGTDGFSAASGLSQG